MRSKLLGTTLLGLTLAACSTGPAGLPDAAGGPDAARVPDAAEVPDAASVPDAAQDLPDGGLLEDAGQDAGAAPTADAGAPPAPDGAVSLLPAPDETFLLGAAGAPAPLFGPEASPTFTAGFAVLRQAGFNRFMPLFLTSETTGTTHWTHFLPPLTDLPRASSCLGPLNAWDELPDGLLVTFPAYLTLLDQAETSTLAPELAEERLGELLDQCLGGSTRRLGEAYLQDEPANRHIGSIFDQEPGTYPLVNVDTLAAAARRVLGRPTFLVEAPIPFLLPYLGVTPRDALIIEPAFWQAVDRTTAAADYYGFDVYPVDLTSDLTSVPEYVGQARAHAPAAKPIVVLQGMGHRDLGVPLGTSGRRPTRAESRAMAFAAVAAGARGIYWFGQSATTLADGALWADLLALVSDLRRSSGVFALPYSSFRFRPSVVGATFAGADQTFVVLSNLADRQTATPLPISAAVDIFDGLSGELLRAGAGALDEVPLQPYEARLLVLQRP